MADERKPNTKDNSIMRSPSRALGFRPQKELAYNKVLPYADELDAESRVLFAEIKENLGRAVMLREIKPGCSIWSNKLYK